jgi:AraC-like DNA-binding protein
MSVQLLLLAVDPAFSDLLHNVAAIYRNKAASPAVAAKRTQPALPAPSARQATPRSPSLGTQAAAAVRPVGAILLVEERLEQLETADPEVIAPVLAALLRQAEGQARALPAPEAPRLAKWRLKRVTDHIDAHLGEALSLPALAQAAGLSRSYFAAQFKLATGLKPHDYVLARKMERAKELLKDPAVAIVDIALGLGFQTQAHFTTVFKRYVGQPPRRWRQSVEQDRAG